MCGNAARCIGKYVYDLNLTRKQSITLDTLSGIKTIQLHIDNDSVRNVTVDMGVPVVDRGFTKVTVGGVTCEGVKASMGNPHFVVVTDDVSAIDLAKVGPLLEHASEFPDRANVEFAEVRSSNNVRMRVWERGSGITMACGTGACATLAVCAATGKTAREATIEMDGGALSILWDDRGRIQMTGEAVLVFEGDIEAA